MPDMSVVSNKDSRFWAQSGGIGADFLLYNCHALTNWARSYSDTTYIECKSSDDYDKKVVKRTIAGQPDRPTFTVVAYTSSDADFLLNIDCAMDFQVYYGYCSSPSDVTGYTKIRHFYRAHKTSESESDIDGLDLDPYSSVNLSVDFTAEEVVEILPVTVTRQNSGVTEAQGFNDIAVLREARCEGGCGTEIKPCYWGVAVADANYGVTTANVWVTKVGGSLWTICPVDPFAANSANISTCVILPGETTPRIIVFRGNVFSDYGARCSISDDWGASWDEVDMGGNANGSYVNAAFKYSSGSIWAVGNGGYIYYSLDQGASWTEIAGATTGTLEELWDIHSPDDLTIYAVGDSNTVIKSTDAGASWADTTTDPAASAVALLTVQAPTEYRVIVGGRIDTSSDVLWISEDGGVTWNDNDFLGSETAGGEVRRVRLADKADQQHYVMLHGVNDGATARYGPGTNFRLFRTLNGAASWERMNLVTNSGLNGLSVCTINKAWASGEPTAAGVADIQRMAP